MTFIQLIHISTFTRITGNMKRIPTSIEIKRITSGTDSNGKPTRSLLRLNYDVTFPTPTLHGAIITPRHPTVAKLPATLLPTILGMWENDLESALVFGDMRKPVDDAVRYEMTLQYRSTEPAPTPTPIPIPTEDLSPEANLAILRSEVWEERENLLALCNALTTFLYLAEDASVQPETVDEAKRKLELEGLRCSASKVIRLDFLW